ncbi:MAG: hypothetical protein GKR77_01210 [Legionellales bacterium]|nr:hypothetical protein [Legionellales bacterium]
MPKSYKLTHTATPAVSSRRHRVATQTSSDLKHPHALAGLVHNEDNVGGDSDREKPRIRELFGLPQDETHRMYIEQRELEQTGHRRLGKVNAREKSPELPSGDLQKGQGYQAHPLLANSQRFDGVDPKVNPMAVLASHDPEIANELEKNRAEQQHDKELRLSLQKGNDHTYTSDSTPTLNR